MDRAADIPVTAGSWAMRAWKILLTPKAEWAVIDGEPASVRSLYVPYVLVLAAVGPLALLIGGQTFGYSAFGVNFRPTLGASLTAAAVNYVLALFGVLVVALAINGAAPRFGGTRNRIQALKVAVYSSTAAWLAGAFQITPSLFWLSIVGFYSLYLLALGLPVLMKVPRDRATGCIVAVTVVSLIIWLMIGATGNVLSRFLIKTAGLTGAVGITVPGG